MSPTTPKELSPALLTMTIHHVTGSDFCYRAPYLFHDNRFKRQQYLVNQHFEIERDYNTIELSTEASCSSTRLFFGGSFDPPHLGHAQLPTYISGQLESNPHLIYVPAARSPFKHAAPVADKHRLNMLTLCTAHTPCSEIWSQELADAPLNLGQPSYWADTWQILVDMRLPGNNLFLIGADQALSMHRWKRYAEFWKHAIVMLRADVDSPTTLLRKLQELGAWSPEDVDHWSQRIITTPTVDASSTAIRHALANTEQRRSQIRGLDARVHQYILEHDLYTSLPIS